MKKVAQQCSTGAGAGGGVRATRGKSATSGKSASRGKSATRGADRATSGANLCHQWHYNYQGNYQRTKGAGGQGEGEVSKRVIPFASPAPTNVVPLHAPEPIGVNFCAAPAAAVQVVPMLYANEAVLLAKVVPCRAAEEVPPKIVSAQDASRIWLQEVIGAPWYDSHKEALVVMALDTRRQCRQVFLVSLGTLSETLASPREVFRPLIVAAAHSFILCHNHPSGVPDPSPPDRDMTKTMQEAGQLIGIPLLDSIIFGNPTAEGVRYYSFSENHEL